MRLECEILMKSRPVNLLARSAPENSSGVFGKAAQTLVRPWALILGGRLYGANI